MAEAQSLRKELAERWGTMKDPAAGRTIIEDTRVTRIARELCEKAGVPMPGTVGVSRDIDAATGSYFDHEQNGKAALLIKPIARGLDDNMLRALLAHEIGHHARRDQLTQNRKIVQSLLKLPIPTKIVSIIANFLHRAEERAADKFMVDTVGDKQAAKYLTWVRKRTIGDQDLGHCHTGLHDEHDSLDARITKALGSKTAAANIIKQVRSIPELAMRSDLWEDGLSEADLESRHAEDGVEQQAREGRVAGSVGGARSRRSAAQRPDLSGRPGAGHERPQTERSAERPEPHVSGSRHTRATVADSPEPAGMGI